MLKFTPNARISFEVRQSGYTPGKGATPDWQPIVSNLGQTPISLFPCEWTNAFGSDVLAAASMNIKQMATVRMGFCPQVYNALMNKEVKIYLNGDTQHYYKAIGNCDNVKMENRLLEFKVQRTEVK